MIKHENQTDFAQMEPLLEDTFLPEAPAVPQDLEDEAVQAAKKRKLYVILGIAATSILLFTLLLFVIFSTDGQQPDAPELPSLARPTSDKDVTQLDRELQVLKDRLDVIDPTKEYVTVPPVDYTLRLE